MKTLKKLSLSFLLLISIGCSSVRDDNALALANHSSAFRKEQKDEEGLAQKKLIKKEISDALSKSKKTWENLKKEHQGTYSYLLESGLPGWTPNRYRTILRFENNILADYSVTPLEGSINEEMKKNLPLAKTLDELYEECANIIAGLGKDENLELNFFTNGLLATCNHIPCGLMDSEGEGINLRALSLGNAKFFSYAHFAKQKALSLPCD